MAIKKKIIKMKNNNLDTLSEVMNILTNEGYTEDFKAEDRCIKALYSKKEYQPNNLKIIKSYRFEGMEDPGDEAELFAIIASDGNKGTLVMSYSAEHSQNTDLIKQIKSI
jgi:ribosomal protein S8